MDLSSAPAQTRAALLFKLLTVHLLSCCYCSCCGGRRRKSGGGGGCSGKLQVQPWAQQQQQQQQRQEQPPQHLCGTLMHVEPWPCPYGDKTETVRRRHSKADNCCCRGIMEIIFIFRPVVCHFPSLGFSKTKHHQHQPPPATRQQDNRRHSRWQPRRLRHRWGHLTKCGGPLRAEQAMEREPFNVPCSTQHVQRWRPSITCCRSTCLLAQMRALFDLLTHVRLHTHTHTHTWCTMQGRGFKQQYRNVQLWKGENQRAWAHDKPVDKRRELLFGLCANVWR